MSTLRPSKRKLSRRSTQKADANFLDMTPMIDVVFILIVFFVLTSNVSQNVFDLELPKADKNYTEESEGNTNVIKLTLFTSGEYAIGESKAPGYDAFTNAILLRHKEDEEAKFLIITESTLAVEKLMSLLTFLKSHNITKIDILLQKS